RDVRPDRLLRDGGCARGYPGVRREARAVVQGPLSGSTRTRPAQGVAAMRSISTRVPGTSSPVVPTLVRGGGVGKNSRHASLKPAKFARSVWNTCALTTVVRGGGVEKNSRQTSSNAKKLFRSVWNTWALTTRSSDVPAASKVRARFSRTYRVWRLISDP